jgi:hypothetical protein
MKFISHSLIIVNQIAFLWLKILRLQFIILFSLFFVRSGLQQIFGKPLSSATANLIMLLLTGFIGFFLPIILIKNSRMATNVICSAICILLSGLISFTALVNISFLFPIIKKINIEPLSISELTNKYRTELELAQKALPSNWKLLSVERAEKLDWVFVSGYNGLELKAYGPETGCQEYYDAQGRTTTECISNEGRIIWIMPEKFNPNWSFLNLTFGESNLMPIDFPAKIFLGNHANIFARETIIILPENQELAKNTPKGYIGGRGIKMPVNGGSWPNWEISLSQTFAKNTIKQK